MEALDYDQKYVRQKDIIPLELFQERITVIGAGAVGSSTVLALAKTGFKRIRVFDFDNVEIHNMPNQMFRIHDLGKPKVTALKEIVKDFEGIEITAVNSKFPNRMMGDTVIVAVDSMDTRIELWETAKKFESKVKLYIDARMGAEVMRLYTLMPSMKRCVSDYADTLYPSSDAVQAPCTAKATMYTALMLGSMIVNQAKRSYMSFMDEEYDYPEFEIIYDLKSGQMLTK